jgi:hypothetical protein
MLPISSDGINHNFQKKGFVDQRFAAVLTLCEVFFFFARQLFVFFEPYRNLLASIRSGGSRGYQEINYAAVFQVSLWGGKVA